MAYIFDGKKFASEIETDLTKRVRKLAGKGIVPRLVSIIVGDDPASILYVNLKKKAAERVGCELEIIKLDQDIDTDGIQKIIRGQNDNPKTSGIMIQLPLPDKFSKNDRSEIINTINPLKDIDGLREESKFTPPTAKAVLKILSISEKYGNLMSKPATLTIVGATGFIGKQIKTALEKDKKDGYRIISVNSKTDELGLSVKDSDIVISVTGTPDLIKADMIKDEPGSLYKPVLIDVGSPKGDIEKSAYEKASFVSPVPGGVGPVTIMCLLDNLVESVS